MELKLFTASATDFSYLGDGCLGYLQEATSCKVSEELNGAFELTMEYPLSGKCYSALKLRRIILAKPNPYTDAQPFRIYSISKPMRGVVTVNAAHISYDLSGVIDLPFTAEGLSLLFNAFSTYAVGTMPFTFWTDISGSSESFTNPVPTSVRSLLGSEENSILKTYGGEWEFDGLACKLYAQRGADRGFSVRYGKNLTEMTEEEDDSDIYTKLLPYWRKEATEEEPEILITLPEHTVDIFPDATYTKVLVADLSDKFEEEPTENELREAAQAYIIEEKLAEEGVGLSVSFVQLEKTEEYKNLYQLAKVYLGDTISIHYDILGVSVTARVIRTEYNCLTDHYISIEVGKYQNTLVDTIARQNREIEDAPKELKSAMNIAIDNATRLITGNAGGHVILHSSNGGKKPDEILIMDTEDIDTALKVWRWNASGLGYSSTGYNGTFGLAMTADGQIVADFITTGVLNAAVLKAGIISDTAGRNFWNLTTGELRTRAMVAENIRATGSFDCSDTSGQKRLLIQNGSVSGYLGNSEISRIDMNGDETFTYVEGGEIKTDHYQGMRFGGEATFISSKALISEHETDTLIDTGVGYTGSASSMTWSNYYFINGVLCRRHNSITPGELIPNDYQEVEYIEMVPTANVFFTGPAPNTVGSFELKFSLVSHVAEQVVFGFGGYFYCKEDANGDLAIYGGFSGETVLGYFPSYNLGQTITFTVSRDSVTGWFKLYADGTYICETADLWVTGTQYIQLGKSSFPLNSVANRSARYSYAKFGNLDGETSAEWIPCYKKDTGVIYFYNRTAWSTVSPSGGDASTLIKGPDVHHVPAAMAMGYPVGNADNDDISPANALGILTGEE